MTASCVYLSILRGFSEHLFYRALPGNCFLYLQVAEFQQAYTVKFYLIILKKNEKQPFERVHLLKIPENNLCRS